MIGTTHPLPDQTAARTLGDSLRSVGYSEETVQDLLGEDAYSADSDDAPVEERRLPQTPVADVVRVFFLQLPISADRAARALGRAGVDAVESTGLADVGDQVVPSARILPIGRVLLASDGFSLDAEDPADYVATYTPTSRLLDSLTPRVRVSRALDVGTGNGVHALLAAKHAEHVVATDVNPRALAYTELNAALNGVTNIECERGSLFDSVGDERFDLVTCNAPYVVSPERRWTYRDGGLEADELSERVVREAAAHLADGGFATLLVSWLAKDEDAPNERALAWAAATGCDSWILPTWESDPLGHAAEWNSHLADDPDAFREALDEWTQYFAELDVRWVSEGAVILQRRPGRRPTTRVDKIDDDDLDDAGEQIQRAFAARARLSELGSPDDLLDARLSVASALRLEEDLEPHVGGPEVSEARVHLADGTNSALEVDSGVLEVIATLDGELPLDAVVKAVADQLDLSGAEAETLRRDALEVSRELLELGALRFH
jgi:methylase of polypeptide subunit release factors